MNKKKSELYSVLGNLIHLSSFIKKLILLVLDFVTLVSVLLLSFSIRFDYWYFPKDDSIFWLVFAGPIIAIAIFVSFGLYRSVTRYFSLNSLWSIVQGVTLYSLIWVVIVYLTAVESIPRSIVLLNWTLSIIAIGGLRLLARWLLSKEKLFHNIKNSDIRNKNVLIYGAGDAGVQLMGGLEHSSEYKPVGFIDDSKEVQGRNIGGINIYSFSEVESLVKTLQVEEILIALPSTSRARRLSIVDSLEPYHVTVRMLPSMADLAGGKVSIDDLRKVSIKDLLGRDAVSANKELLSKNITDK
jgi:FlaA1/EpsC-like NDP-sugar epimerase